MALELGDLYFDLGADTTGLRRAEKEARRFMRETERNSKRTASAVRGIGLAFKAIVSLEVGRRIVMVADNFASLDTRIRTATRATEDYNFVQRELLALSNDTGTGLKDTVSLFQNIARAAPELAATNKQALIFAESIGKLGVIGGSNREEMSFGVRQLSQGLSGGIFRAEELNSILENIPEVASAIARGMGMNTAEMRKAVLAGDMLSKDVFESILTQTAQINSQFEEIPLRVGRATTAMVNSWGSFLNQIDEATGATAGIAAIMMDISDILSSDFSNELFIANEIIEAINESLTLWKFNLSGVSDYFGYVGTDGEEMMAMLSAGFKFLADSIVLFPLNLRTVFALASEAAKRMWLEYEAGYDQIQIATRQFFLRVKQIGLEVVHDIEMGWARAADAVVILFAEAIGAIANSISGIPLLGEQFEGMKQASEEMKRGANAAGAVANKINDSRLAYDSLIATMQIQRDEIESTRSAEIQASKDRSKAVWDNLNSVKGAIEERRAMRRVDFSMEKKMAGDLSAIEDSRLAVVQKQAEELAQVRRDAFVDPRKEKPGDGESSKKEKADTKATNDLSSLTDQLSSELELERNRYDEGIRILQAAEQQKIATIIPYGELRKRLEQDHAEAIAEIRGQDYQAEVERMQPRIDALAQSLLTETEMLAIHREEALENLQIAEELKLETILPYHELRQRLEEEHQKKLNEISKKNSVERAQIEAIGAMMGFKMQKSVGDMSTKEQGALFKSQIDQAAEHSKEFFMIKKAMALATALIEAPSAILSAFSFGNSVGGPIVGGIFAGIAAAATAVQVSAIASQQYRGGKATGGMVTPGGMYEVNERGTEMLSMGGKDYLMMGNQQGQITTNESLRAAGGGGGGTAVISPKTNVIVNVHTLEGQTATVQKQDNDDGVQLDIMIEKIEDKIAGGVHEGGSPLAKAMEGQYGLNRTAGGVS